MSTLLARLTSKTLALGSRCPGVRPLGRRLAARSLAIVMYHGVTATPLAVPNWCQLDAAAFAGQIDFLARHYTLLPLREAVERLGAGQPLPRNPAVLTFDDGFRSVWTTAWPILRRYQAPATVFLVTGVVGSRQPAWPDRLFHTLCHSPAPRVELGGRSWDLGPPARREAAYRGLSGELKRLAPAQREAALGEVYEQLGGERLVDADSPLATLDWDEVAELAGTGLVEFGSHTHTHPILSRCSPAEQERELRLSRDLLRERLGRADLFAYPNGTRADFTADTRRLLEDLDYRCAVSTEPGLNTARTDRYALRRVNVANDTTLAAFERELLGL
jgi:peptidoglycan/xylan/chitin deacetylase (PgdA/CDA1 family)